MRNEERRKGERGTRDVGQRGEVVVILSVAKDPLKFVREGILRFTQDDSWRRDEK